MVLETILLCRTPYYTTTHRPLNSTLRACIVPHVALQTTLGPHTTTHRPLNSTLRACIVPHVALQTTLGPHTTTHRPLNITLRACIVPHVVLETGPSFFLRCHGSVKLAVLGQSREIDSRSVKPVKYVFSP